MPPPRTAATYRARDGNEHDVLVLTTPAGRWRIVVEDPRASWRIVKESS